MVPSKWGICSKCAYSQLIKVRSKAHGTVMVLYCSVRHCRVNADESCLDFMPLSSLVYDFDDNPYLEQSWVG